MAQRFTRFAVALAGATILAGAGAAAAGEKGKFTGHAVLNSTKFTELKSPDGHPGKSVMCGELEGLVFNDGKKPFKQPAKT